LELHILFYQPQDGYRYNSDSLFLYNFISKLLPKGKVLDVGAGSGILGLLVARDHHRVQLEAVEKQEVFQFLSQKNAEINKINYTLHCGDFLHHSFEKSYYEYVISNPPFYHDGNSKSENEIIHNARYSEHLPLKAFFEKVAPLLKPQGHFVFCYDPQMFQEICTELLAVKLRVVDVQFVYPKKEKKASLVMIHARKSSKSMMTVMKPFIAFENAQNYEFSQDALDVYSQARTHSIKCKI
jgi:tRNA1(Val) A37 N6-methylase TrmN6